MAGTSINLRKCRACLENVDAHVCVDLDAPLFNCTIKQNVQDSNDKLTLLEVFNECTQLGVSLPSPEVAEPEQLTCRHLCSACSCELRNAYQFIIKARYSHVLLSQQTEHYKVKLKEELPLADNELQYLDETFDEEVEHEVLQSYGKSPHASNVASPLGVEQALAEIFGLETCDELPYVEVAEKNSEVQIKNEFNHKDTHAVLEKVEELSRVDEAPKESKSIFDTDDDDDDGNDGEEDDEDATSIEVRLVAPDEIEDDTNLMLEYKCELCMAKFDFQRDLVQHYDMNHDDKDLHYHCSSCDHRFYTKSTLNTHFRQIHQNCEYLDCQLCGRTVLKSFFKVHQRRHINQRKYLCSECPSTFTSNYTLKKHLRIHSKDRDRNIECEQCGRKFFTPEAFRTHQITHRAPELRETFNCSLCSKSFMRQTNLKLHMQMHRGETMNCPHCGKQFVRRKDLEIHIRFHTGEFPFVCKTCNQRFAIKGHLTAHEKKHKGIKYQCSQCDKQFINIAGLRQHKFEHTGMPLHCGVCQKGFPTRFKVRRHIRSVHHSLFGDNFKDEDAEQYIKRSLKSSTASQSAKVATENVDVYELEMLEEDADDLVDFLIEEI